MNIQVYILTWCPQPSSLFGNTLVFDTLRTGFPSAEVHVIDNASVPEVRPVLCAAAAKVNGSYHQYDREVPLYSFLEHVLNRHSDGAAVILDPDVCFWESVEGWRFDHLIAGRRLPRYECGFSKCVTHSRLHTSFLWIPDVRRLRLELESIRARYFEFHPFRPSMLNLDGAWHRFDTGASLFAAIPEKAYAFQEPELNAYDHLFCGTHLCFDSRRLPPELPQMFERMHRRVQSDPGSLKGAWRLQDDYFNALAV